jgi:hypothetical protein
VDVEPEFAVCRNKSLGPNSPFWAVAAEPMEQEKSRTVRNSCVEVIALAVYLVI